MAALISLVTTSLIFIAAVFLVRKKFTLITVLGSSMYPTFRTGDRLLVLKRYFPYQYRVGQIVVAYPPYPSPEWREKLYVKRLVGLPGDEVAVPETQLNSQIHVAEADSIDVSRNRIWRLPDTYCFIQGDSHWSEDCRAWGPIPVQLLVGVVCLKLPRRTGLADDGEIVKQAPSAVRSTSLPLKIDGE